MKNHILTTLIIAALLVACKKNKSEIITADLTFRSISFNSMYGGTDEQIANLESEIDSILNLQNPRESDYEIAKYFQKLKQNNLDRLPYIFLLLENDSVITVHLHEKEYEKIKDYRHLDLYKKNNKITLEIELVEVDSAMLYSENIIKVAEINGISQSNK